MQPLNDWSGLSYFSQNQSITHNIIRCNVLQTFAIRGWTTFHQFLYQCDVLRYVEKTKDHANYKCKTVHSPPSPCYWQLMGGGGKTSWFQMVCQLARCISLFLNVVFVHMQGHFLGPLVPFWILSWSKKFTNYPRKHFDPPPPPPEGGPK